MNAMKRPEFCMLIGVPGSGKSTWARKKIEQEPEMKWFVVSSDDILEELGEPLGLTYEQAFKRFAKNAMTEMFRRADVAIKNGRNIIWDQTNLTAKSRNQKLMNVKNNSVFHVVIFDVPSEEVFRRLNQRESTTGKHVPQEVVKGMLDSMTFPHERDGFDTISYVRT